MATSAAQAELELIDLTVTDWDGMRQAHLRDVPRNATVGELLAEVRRIMGLPEDSAYQAILGGRHLNHLDTVEELGIGPGAEITIVPEVEAG